MSARRRKRVRAVDPYLGFYPTSDPLSDAQTTSTNTGPIFLADESIQEPQSTSQGLRAPEPPTSTIQFVHSSSSPEPAFCQPTAPKASYAARKRRRIDSDSDSDGVVEAVTRSAETSSDEDEEDEEVEAPPAAPTRRSTRTATQAHGMHKPSRPRTQLGTVRGPFTTRLIAACLATGAQLDDDLAEINARTIPQLKLTALPLALPKRRISSTQAEPSGRKRVVNFHPRPSFNTANAPDEANARNGAYGANKVRKRLSHLPLPLANTRLPSAILAGHEVASRPGPRKKKREEARVPSGIPPLRMASGKALKHPRTIRVTTVHENDTLLKEGGLKMTTLRSFDRAARALRTRVKADSTSPPASPIPNAVCRVLTRSSFANASSTYVPVPAPSPRSLLDHDSNLMDRSFSPIPVTPGRRPHPRPSITQFSPSPAHDNDSNESPPPPPTFGTKIPLPFSPSTSPQSLSDSRSRIDVLVPDSPSPPVRRARTQRSSDAGIFIPASLDMPTSSSASVHDLEAARTNGNFDLSSLHILVPDSSHVLVSDSIFVPASLDDTSYPSTPSQEEDEEEEDAVILVPDSSHVLAPETQPNPPAPARRFPAPRRPGAPRRPIMLKSINELSDSFLEKIAKNGAIFGRPPARSYL
ncbi:hypothetical protein EXIGLDRAFT_759643 [Exidia glandulosa HHB12029]|uniref:Uncharacterized protein n=1 Tax=Exidia glandulosa HHB12029 TaxID=1314781 RepID=A0A165Q154_EXIGL|nr:hypothetical protein EXIGLDRAFT_759643 [Exidia glandulosa HHB12029]